MVYLGQVAPDFEQDTTNGSIRFHQWIARSWCLLFSPVSTAKLVEATRLRPEWSKRGIKPIGLSVGSSDNLAVWVQEVERAHNFVLGFPVIADADRTVSMLYGLDLSLTANGVFVIDSDKNIRLMPGRPPAIGCLDKVLRTIDCLQRPEGHRGAARKDAAAAGGAWPGLDACAAAGN